MKRHWAFSLFILLILGGAFAVYHHTRSAARNNDIKRVAVAFLKSEAEIPQRRADRTIKHLVTPGSQAYFWVNWLTSEDQYAAQHAPLTVKSAEITIRHFTIHRQQGQMVAYLTLTVTRMFRPKGLNQAKVHATLWMSENAAHNYRIRMVSLNYSNDRKPGSADQFNLNLWNLAPSPPQPQGQ